jgi:uncharacterized LabA/DUF88 family protein
MNQPGQRVLAYIDGFNFYFGLRDSGLRRYLWLNLHKMAERLLLPDQTLVKTKYFTSRISGARPGDAPDRATDRNAKRKRQQTFLEALGTVPEIEIFYGKYMEQDAKCSKCGDIRSVPSEKMTDVCIATEMIMDAFANAYDTALLISADSDLVPPVTSILSRIGYKRIVVAFPPGRNSEQLKKCASGQFVITKGPLKKSLFPPEITTAAGYTLRCPAEWKSAAT